MYETSILQTLVIAIEMTTFVIIIFYGKRFFKAKIDQKSKTMDDD